MWVQLGDITTPFRPITIYAAVLSTNATTTQTIFSHIDTANGTDGYYLFADGTTGGDPLLWQMFDSGNGIATTTAGFTSGTAYTASAFENSSGVLRAVWINGGSGATNTTSSAPVSGWETVSVGAERGILGFCGYIFEVIILNSLDTDAQRAAMENYLKRKWAIP